MLAWFCPRPGQWWRADDGARFLSLVLLVWGRKLHEAP